MLWWRYFCAVCAAPPAQAQGSAVTPLCPLGCPLGCPPCPSPPHTIIITSSFLLWVPSAQPLASPHSQPCFSPGSRPVPRIQTFTAFLKHSVLLFPPSSILFFYFPLFAADSTFPGQTPGNPPGPGRDTKQAGCPSLQPLRACSDPALGALIHAGGLSRDPHSSPSPCLLGQGAEVEGGGPRPPKSPILPALTCLWGPCD